MTYPNLLPTVRTKNVILGINIAHTGNSLRLNLILRELNHCTTIPVGYFPKNRSIKPNYFCHLSLLTVYIV